MQPRYLLAVLLLAACGDQSGTTPPVDSAPAIDAPADTRPDASFATPLIGTWVKSADAYADQTYRSVTFRADGTATIVRASGTGNGPYLVPAPGRVRFIDGTSFLETEFVTQNDQLLIDALLPQGPVTGFVGTWTGTLVFETGTYMTQLTLGADHSASGRTTSMASGTTTVTGTWAAEGTGFALTWTVPIVHVEHVRPLGTLGSGPQLLTKQP